ncbi:MAG: hemolysin III family protein [Actinomycetota bacterium]|nr:hemolysin III family protein [Actinomycetota bacterium]
MDTQPVRAVVEAVFTKPLLRGWLHLVCFFLAIPAGIVVISLADGTAARVGAVVYAVGLVALFGVSGIYHRGRWSQEWRRRMQRLDHATIFVMIAGSYTPLCLVAIKGWVGPTMLVVAWLGAVLGAVLAFSDGGRSRVVRGALYIVLGWISVLAGPALVRNLSVAELVLIAVGGVLFTIGAITLMTHWPDPFPRVFGYHEVWHVLVVAAVVCHFVAIASVVDAV